MRRAGLALLLLFLWPLPVLEAAEQIEGRVTAISEGNTLPEAR